MNFAGEIRVAVAAVLAAGFSGCGLSAGPPFHQAPPPPGLVTIYVYRPYHYFQFQDPIVTCGDETLEIYGGSYHAFKARSGEITCSAQDNPAGAVHFDARADQEYYVKEDVRSDMTSTQVKFILMTRTSGLGDAKSCCQEQE